MAVQVKLNTTQSKKLIKLVQDRPALYDSKYKKHHDKQYLNNAWTKIGKEMDIAGLTGKP